MIDCWLRLDGRVVLVDPDQGELIYEMPVIEGSLGIFRL